MWLFLDDVIQFGAIFSQARVELLQVVSFHLYDELGQQSLFLCIIHTAKGFV